MIQELVIERVKIPPTANPKYLHGRCIVTDVDGLEFGKTYKLRKFGGTDLVAVKDEFGKTLVCEPSYFELV